MCQVIFHQKMFTLKDQFGREEAILVLGGLARYAYIISTAACS
jgi:hypothetical protein